MTVTARCMLAYVSVSLGCLLTTCSTFLKRKGGLFKKAHELSVLCSVDVAVIIFGHNKKLYEFSSGDIHETLRRYSYVSVTAIHCLAELTKSSMASPTNTKAPPTSKTRAAVTMMTTKRRKKAITMLRKIQCHHNLPA